MPVIVAVRDLLFRSKIQAAAERLGVTVRLVPRGAPLAEVVRGQGPCTVLADLGEPGILEQVQPAKLAAALRVVGFLGHLEEDLARAAAEHGVDEVLTRGQLAQRLDAILVAAAGDPQARR